MILGGDLGGTKTLLALAERGDGKLHIVREQRFASADHPNFDDLLAEFLTNAPPIASACFGIAGHTDGLTAQLTYLPWHLSAHDLSRRFGIGRVTLANDFAAAANGLPLLEEKQIVSLHAGQPIIHAPRVILGAGTGLGVAGLVWDKNRYRVIPGEGGHFGFSPQTPEQGELWRWLLATNGRVTTEDIVSGPGLARIYAFLGGRPRPEGSTLGVQQPENIGQAALAKTDPLAEQALQLWLACYGAFAGDLALHWLARGGVYLAGGIAAKLMPYVDTSPFISAFLAKREHAELVKNMPIYLLTAEDLGLRGALALAADHD
ncbi:MAG: glucokinase [Azonexus sp.]|nr:glucokinase [Azonexus sp.]